MKLFITALLITLCSAVYAQKGTYEVAIFGMKESGGEWDYPNNIEDSYVILLDNHEGMGLRQSGELVFYVLFENRDPHTTDEEGFHYDITGKISLTYGEEPCSIIEMKADEDDNTVYFITVEDKFVIGIKIFKKFNKRS